MRFLDLLMRVMTHFNIGALMATVGWLIWMASMMTPDIGFSASPPSRASPLSNQPPCCTRQDAASAQPEQPDRAMPHDLTTRHPSAQEGLL